MSDQEKTPLALNGTFVHTVFFWLKDPNDAPKFEASLRKFAENSIYINSLHIGKPAPTARPVIDNSYHYNLLTTFNSKEDHDKYQDEPAHHIFIEECKELWEKVQVFDSVR